MRMLNVVIDLRDLYPEIEYDRDCGPIGGDTAESMITREVKNEVVSKLAAEIRSKVADKAFETAEKHMNDSQFEEAIINRINLRIDELTRKGSRYSRAKSLDSYIADRIHEHVDKRLNNQLIDKRVNEAFKALEQQYNEKFAVGIITKLKEVNMLTDEAKSLLAANKED